MPPVVHPPAAAPLTYGSYLRLGELLALQTPLTHSRHEPVFIAVHQCIEILWKAAVHLNDRALADLAARRLDGVPRALAQVCGIIDETTATSKLLEGLTPLDFAEFRDALGSASGAQSQQYHLLEKQSGFSRVGHDATVPTLRAAFLGLLVDEGITAAAHWAPSIGLQSAPVDCGPIAALLPLYRDPALTRAARIADALFDYDNALANFRWHHYQLVQRLIGSAPGTAGTRGLDYLAQTLRLRLFPELTALRAGLVQGATR